MTKTSPSAAEDDRTAKCRKLLAELQRTCPEVLPRPPLPVVKPGEVATTATVEPRSLQRLVRSAITPDSGDAFVWNDATGLHIGYTALDTFDDFEFAFDIGRDRFRRQIRAAAPRA